MVGDMTDKIMAIVALLTMIGFLVVVAAFVPEPDLILVIALVSAMAIYDFWLSFRSKRN